jgi:hypothetical protein
MIENEIESSSNGMPNITTSKVAAREIGFGQESSDKRSNGTAAVTSDAAFVAIFKTASASPYAPLICKRKRVKVFLMTSAMYLV